MRILPEHPFGDETAVFMADQNCGAAPGIAIPFRKGDRAADGLRLAGIGPRKASPALDDLPSRFLIHHDISGINHGFSGPYVSVAPQENGRDQKRFGLKLFRSREIRVLRIVDAVAASLMLALLDGRNDGRNASALGRHRVQKIK
jgi:hypothetical protein